MFSLLTTKMPQINTSLEIITIIIIIIIIIIRIITIVIIMFTTTPRTYVELLFVGINKYLIYLNSAAISWAQCPSMNCC